MAACLSTEAAQNSSDDLVGNITPDWPFAGAGSGDIEDSDRMINNEPQRRFDSRTHGHGSSVDDETWLRLPEAKLQCLPRPAAQLTFRDNQRAIGIGDITRRASGVFR